MRKLGFLVLALALVATGAMTAQPLMAAGEGASGAEFTTGLFLPLVQAPDELSVEAAKKPAFLTTKVKSGSFGPEDDPSTVGDGMVYLPNVHPADVCEDLTLEIEDDYWYGLKVEGAAPNGEYTSGDLTIEISNSDGKFFDWTASASPAGQTVGAVVVKAGTGANAYLYPAYYEYWEEVQPDSPTPRLHAPGFEKKGKFIYRDISNVTFCLVESIIVR